MLALFVHLVLVGDLQVLLDYVVGPSDLSQPNAYLFLLKEGHVRHELPVVNFSLLVLPKLGSIRILILTMRQSLQTFC